MPLLSSGSLAPNYFPFVTEKVSVPTRNCSLTPSWLFGEALLEVLVLLLAKPGVRKHWVPTWLYWVH